MKLYWFVVAALLCLWVTPHLSLAFAVKNTKPVLPNYETVTFTLDTGDYDQFLKDLRGRLTGGTYAKIPILRDPSTVRPAEQYILVALTDYSSQTIKLAVDVTNVYIVGYFAKSDRFWHFKDVTQSQINQFFPGVKAESLGFGSSYLDLESKGQDRGNTPLGLPELSTAIGILYYTEKGRGSKKSLLVTVQAIAEATRFQYIADRVKEGVPGAGEQIKSYENNWTHLSKSVQKGDGVKLDPPVQLKNNEGKTYTVTLVEDLIGSLSLMNFYKKGTVEMETTDDVVTVY